MNGILSLVPLLALCTVTSAKWQNGFDADHLYECPGNAGHVTTLQSEHSNNHEDRRFRVGCKGNKLRELNSCVWSGNVNNWDQTFHFMCNENRVLAGMRSKHSNYHEDRQFDFKCCKLQGTRPTKCTLGDWMNNWDAPFLLDLPSSQAVVGVFSEHHNGVEDRKFRFLTCNV